MLQQCRFSCGIVIILIDRIIITGLRINFGSLNHKLFYSVATSDFLVWIFKIGQSRFFRLDFDRNPISQTGVWIGFSIHFVVDEFPLRIFYNCAQSFSFFLFSRITFIHPKTINIESSMKLSNVNVSNRKKCFPGI